MSGPSHVRHRDARRSSVAPELAKSASRPGRSGLRRISSKGAPQSPQIHFSLVYPSESPGYNAARCHRCAGSTAHAHASIAAPGVGAHARAGSSAAAGFLRPPPVYAPVGLRLEAWIGNVLPQCSSTATRLASYDGREQNGTRRCCNWQVVSILAIARPELTVIAAATA